MATDYNDIPIMRELYRLYFQYDQGISDIEAGALLRVTRQQVRRYRLRMPGVYCVTRGRYSCVPSAEQITMAHAILSRALYEQRLRDAKRRR